MILKTAKKLILNYIPLKLIDKFFYLQVIFIAPFLKLYTKFGGGSLPQTRELFKANGVYPIADHYYQPLFNDSRLKKSLREERILPGIDFNLEEQLDFLKSLKYKEELISLKLNQPPKTVYDFNINGAFKFGDAEFLYQMIRYLKPKRIIEVGSGSSTRLACKAKNKNFEESGLKAQHICIEPYEMPWLENSGVIVIRDLLENCDIGLFRDLEANDFLFIDSSHIIRPQGDVLKEYLEIIPMLKKGVYIHVHDIFTPRDYLDSWIREEIYLWNEQYLLEALLSNTRKYKIVAALNLIYHSNYESLKKVCPYITANIEPGSFYFRIQE